MKWKLIAVISILVAIASVAVCMFLTAQDKSKVQAEVADATVSRSSEEAAPDSVEWQLRSHHQSWRRITGEITEGAYVQDILRGRLQQPQGRGAIGKVVSVDIGHHGVPVAIVDFGRGYTVGIYFSELSLVNVGSE